MIYPNVFKAVFISRPNRFIAAISIDGNEEICHVKNTGRLGELLVPGCEVYVQKCDDEKRKTGYDLIAVKYKDQIVNIDSQAPNKVVGQWLRDSGYFSNITYMKPECKYGNSRFDFYLECEGRKIFIEVKGVTLKQGRRALFPDAPTERGIKHLSELCSCIGEGFEAYVIFLIKMKNINIFSPNTVTHPEFTAALKNAIEKGVKVICLDCRVTPDSLEADNFIDCVVE